MSFQDSMFHTRKTNRDKHELITSNDLTDVCKNVQNSFTRKLVLVIWREKIPKYIIDIYWVFIIDEL